MPTETETLKEIQRLLANGETQAASDLAAAAELDARKAADAAAGKPSTPPTPRNPDVIVVAFMEAVASRHGHHPDLDLLVAEMKASLKALHEDPIEPAPEPAPAPVDEPKATLRRRPNESDADFDRRAAQQKMATAIV